MAVSSPFLCAGGELDKSSGGSRWGSVRLGMRRRLLVSREVSFGRESHEVLEREKAIRWQKKLGQRKARLNCWKFGKWLAKMGRAEGKMERTVCEIQLYSFFQSSVV